MRRREAIAVIGGVVVSVFLLTYFWSTSQQIPRLRIGHLLADELHQPAWAVAREMGYNITSYEILHSEYINGPSEMEHFAAGELDAAYVGAAPFLAARAAGVDIVAVASSNTEGSSLVVEGGIAFVADLQGKRIGTPGIGTIQDYMLNRIEEEYNIKVDHFYAKVTDLIIYFEKGEIDGYIAWEPHPTNAILKGYRGAQILLTSNDILPGHQCCVLAVRENWRKNRPDVVEKIVEWHMNAQKWALDHPDEAKQIIAKTSGLPFRLIEAASYTVKYPYPPYLHKESMKIIVEGLIKSGKIKDSDVSNPEQFVEEAIDNSFAEKVTKRLKR